MFCAVATLLPEIVSLVPGANATLHATWWLNGVTLGNTSSTNCGPQFRGCKSQTLLWVWDSYVENKECRKLQRRTPAQPPLDSSRSANFRVTLSIRFLNDTASVLFLFEGRLYSSSFETKIACSKLTNRRNSQSQRSFCNSPGSKVIQKVVIENKVWRAISKYESAPHVLPSVTVTLAIISPDLSHSDFETLARSSISNYKNISRHFKLLCLLLYLCLVQTDVCSTSGTIAFRYLMTQAGQEPQLVHFADLDVWCLWAYIWTVLPWKPA